MSEFSIFRCESLGRLFFWEKSWDVRMVFSTDIRWDVRQDVRWDIHQDNFAELHF